MQYKYIMIFHKNCSDASKVDLRISHEKMKIMSTGNSPIAEVFLPNSSHNLLTPRPPASH